MHGDQRELKVRILAKCDGGRVLVQDTASSLSSPKSESLQEFEAAWTAELLLITSRASISRDLSRFDFTWFIPSIVKYRRLLARVGCAAARRGRVAHAGRM